MSSSKRKPETTLAGNRLWIARILWLAFLLTTLAVYVEGIPALRHQLAEACNSAECLTEQVTAQEAIELSNLGYSLANYAGFQTGLETVTALFSLAIGLIIVWRKRNDWMVMFVSAVVVGFGLSSGDVIEALEGSFSLSRSQIEAIEGIWGWVPLTFFLFLFPDGSFVPRWGRWLAFGWGILQLTAVLFPSSWFNSANWSDSAQLLAFIGLMWAPGISAQVYRYRFVSAPIERQQTKFVLLGLFGTALIGGAATLLSFAFRGNAQLGIQYRLVLSGLDTIGFLLIPLSIGLSVLGYRLWEIDPIINRALVYSTLTAVLAVVFAGSIALVDQISQEVVGEGSAALSAVVSTFLVVIFFQPMRSRLEQWITKRFYPDQLDLTTGLVELEPHFWQVTSLPRLLSAATSHICDSLDCREVAIFLGPSGQALELDCMRAVSGHRAELSDFTPKELGELGRARAVLHTRIQPFVGYVPLYVPRRGANDIVGILAFGHRSRQKGYSGTDLKHMAQFGRKLGEAIYALRLRDELPENRDTSHLFAQDPIDLPPGRED